MLIVSNTADPITPLSSGQEINEVSLLRRCPLNYLLFSISNFLELTRCRRRLLFNLFSRQLMGSSSRLLIQDSPGHCSLGSVSNCTTTHYRRYYLEGYVPEDNFKCGIDAGFFPVKNLNLNSKDSVDESVLTHAERRTKGWNDWILTQV